MSFISQHTSANIERALSSVVADTTGSNPATAQTALTSSWTVPLWTGNAAFVTIENLTTHVASQPFSQLTFDTAAGVESDAAGELSWDEDAETVMLALDDQIHMHIGQDSFYHVVNQTGSAIPKGTGVYATGTLGSSGKITAAPFTGNGTYDSKYFMGVTAESIANGATGFVVHFGKIRKLNTNAWEEGDILYASPSVAGGLTNVKPTAPNNIITVAIVVTKSATVGEIFVRPTFIDGFADNEDVTVTSAATGDLLRYNGTVWVNYADSNYASASGLSTHIANTSNPHSVTATQLGLGNVENTALSTWAGSTNLTTLGTITTGTWNGDTIASAYIGSHTHAASDVTSGTFADARIAQTNVTQHQAALSITESQISDFGSYQPLDSGLTSIAGLPTIADKMLYTTASDTYATTTLTSFARSILDDADAATVRTTIGVDAAGTDNSTNVTLATVAGNYLTIVGQEITAGTVPVSLGGTGATTAAGARTALDVDQAGTDNSTNVTIAAGLDYITISGQQLTLGSVDLTTDVTGTLPIANGGTGAATAAAARTALDVDQAGTDNSTNVTLAGTYDYLTLSGQQITLAQIDLATDVTGVLPSGNIGSHTHTASDVTDFSTAADARIALAVLDDLADVVETTITTGDLLRWNGANWVNYADSNYAASGHNHTLDSLSNVTITSIASGEIVKWDGAAWVNNTLSEAGILGLAGGTLTGEVNFADNLLTRPLVKDYAMEVNALGSITTTATIDLENGNVQTATVTGNVTLTFSNPIASGDATSFTLELTNGGAYTVTFPTAVDWEGGTAPTLTAAGVDILVFYTRDGGTTWHGIVSSLDSK